MPALPALTEARRRSAAGWITLVLALYGLNLCLSFHNVWPTPWVTTRHEVSIEIAILLFGLWLWLRWKRHIPPRLPGILAFIMMILTIGRYAEVTAPALYGRPVNIYWDARFIPHVIEMLVEAAHPLLVFALFAGAMLSLTGLFLLIRLALRRVAQACLHPIEHRAVALLTSALIALYLVGLAGVPVKRLHLYSLPVSAMLWQQAGFIGAAIGADETLDALTQEQPLGDYPLPKLGGADVMIHFVESYGAVAFDAPEIAATIADSRAELANAITATGRRVVSAFVESPTFGGGSWLAHSSVMTGLDIDHNGTYNLLLTRDVPTLSTRFRALGYRPVALMPGLRSEWPEGVFYRFEHIYGAAEINYRGPDFGWWRIPDQYSLARLDSLELDKPARPPLFVMFTSISSHMPFRPTPLYQPDWSRILGDTPFDEPALGAALAQLPEWTNMRPAYAGTLIYTFEYLAGFLREQAGRDLLLIVIGDHQPPATVSGEGARWDAPVHVISSNQALLETLKQQGFVDGLIPEQRPIGPMFGLSPMLLEALR